MKLSKILIITHKFNHINKKRILKLRIKVIILLNVIKILAYRLLKKL